MRSPVKLHEELTKEFCKHDLNTLTKASHRVVVVECCNCHQIMHREFRNAFATHSCPIVVGDKKRCFKCEQWKDLSLFNKNPKLNGGVNSLCRQCYNNHDAVKKCEANRREKKKRSFSENFPKYVENRANSVKSNCKRDSIPYDLDKDYLLNLWQEQEGKCYYSNMEMKSEGHINGYQSWFSPSLDRKDPSLGYTKGNIVWACSCVNSFKHTMTDIQFKEMLKNIQWNI